MSGAFSTRGGPARQNLVRVAVMVAVVFFLGRLFTTAVSVVHSRLQEPSLAGPPAKGYWSDPQAVRGQLTRRATEILEQTFPVG